MNNEQTIKAVTPILTNYFHGLTTAEFALDLIGPLFKENSKGKPSGYRVIDSEGDVSEFPNAASVSVDRLDLYLHDEDKKTIAIFHRWSQVERIA